LNSFSALTTITTACRATAAITELLQAAVIAICALQVQGCAMNRLESFHRKSIEFSTGSSGYSSCLRGRYPACENDLDLTITSTTITITTAADDDDDDAFRI